MNSLLSALHRSAFLLTNSQDDPVVKAALMGLLDALGRGMGHAAVARRRQKLMTADPAVAAALLSIASEGADLLTDYARALQEFNDDDAEGPTEEAAPELDEPADEAGSGSGRPGDAEEPAADAPDEAASGAEEAAARILTDETPAA